MQKDRALLITGLFVLGLVVLWLVSTIFLSAGFGLSGRNSMMGYYTPGISGYGINSFLNFIVQVLLVGFIAIFLIGIVGVARNTSSKNESVAEVNESKINDSTSSIQDLIVEETKQESKINCIECGYELEPEWRVCPNCMRSKE